VELAAEVPGNRTARRPHGGRFRSRREISRRGQRALYALLPGGHSPVPVPSCAFADGWMYGAVESLLDLWEPRGRREAEFHAGAGPQPSLAGGAGEDRGHSPDGRYGHPRLFRAAAEVARRAESR